MNIKNGITKIVRKNGYTYIYLSATIAQNTGRGLLAVARVLIAITGALAFTIAGIIIGSLHEMS